MTIKTKFHIILLFTILPFFGTAQVLLSPNVENIPMRDGKSLKADVYLPDTINQYPVILIQTPYSRLPYRLTGLPLGIEKDLANSNYAFVIVDWRGFFGSLGAIVANPNRGEDGYDVVQWIASQSWSDGKVGTWGPSALGKIQYQTARENPPNLTCCVPLVAGSQNYYHEYFPGGVYRTEYVEQLDGLGFGVSSWLLAHPTYDLFWQFLEPTFVYPAQIQVPNLMIGGWYDHNVEVMLELFDLLKTQSPVSVRDDHKLLMGPWTHGGVGTAQVGDSLQGEIPYDNAAGWNDAMAMEFFDYHLRNISNGWENTPDITYYQMGENKWESDTQFPPSAVANEKFYLKSLSKLSPGIPSNASDSSPVFYNPKEPSPTVGGPTLKAGLLQGPYDLQSTVLSRFDYLLFETETLFAPLKIKGAINARIFLSSDRTDTDIALRLTDVYPDGRSVIFSDGIRRGRFRNGFTSEDSLVPGQIYALDVEFPATALTIMPGHKLRVIVTSSNYPRFDNNLNNGDSMYVAGDTLNATNTIYFNSNSASYLELPLEDFNVGIKDDLGENSIMVYPNPSEGILFVHTDDPLEIEEWDLIDLRGKSININIRSIHSKLVRIETHSIPVGLYFLRMKKKGIWMSKKIMIQ